MKELQRQAAPNIVIALAGNKADLTNKRMVEAEEAQSYAEENGLLFMETSAKTAVNVNEIFLAIGGLLILTSGEALKMLALFLAKKLPKETAGAAAGNGGGRRLVEGADNPKTTTNCCRG